MSTVRLPPRGDPFSSAPHACNDGWVTVGYMSVDPETGEEVEEYAQYLYQRCAGQERGARTHG